MVKGKPISYDGGTVTDLDRLCRHLATKGEVGSAVSVAAAVWRHGRWIERFAAFGVTSRVAPARAVDRETLFDLASVTKPVTALAVARLARAGAMDLRAPLSRYIPFVPLGATGDAPVELLLAHRAGLVGHRALFRALASGLIVPRDALLSLAAEARRADAHPPFPQEGFTAEYSDMGYLLLGEAVARVTSLPLDTALRELVLAPLCAHLASARQWRALEARAHQRVAATEVAPWRGGLLRGVVHDENAWAFSGESTSGHAGLFGGAQGVLRLGEGVLDALAGRTPWFLTADEMRALVRARSSSTLRAGFDGRSPRGSSAGAKFGPHTFGHLGYTGTSLWCDPDAQVVGVLLTNRVHPTRESPAIRTVRPLVYDAIADWAGAELSGSARR